MKQYLIEETALNALRRVMKRLYTETRMNGDEMRDAAHTINAVIGRVIEMPEDLYPGKKP